MAFPNDTPGTLPGAYAHSDRSSPTGYCTPPEECAPTHDSAAPRSWSDDLPERAAHTTSPTPSRAPSPRAGPVFAPPRDGCPVFTARPPVPPGRLANAPALAAFRQGELSYGGLMKITTSVLRDGCPNADWQGALACLDAIRSTRDPRTGQLLVPDRICFNAAMVSCARSGRYLETIDLFNAITQHGLGHDRESFHYAMEACGYAGRPQDVLRLFRFMQCYGPAQGVRVGPVSFAIAIEFAGIPAAMELLQEGVAARVFRPELGLRHDGVLDVRQNAVFESHWEVGRRHNNDLRPNMVYCLVRHAMLRGRPFAHQHIKCQNFDRLRPFVETAAQDVAWLRAQAAAPGRAD